MTTVAAPSDPQLAGWREESHRLAADYHALVQPLSRDQLRWRPAPGSWSILEILDHLAITTEKVVHFVDQAADRGRARGTTGVGPFGYGWLGAWFLRQLAPNPRKPTPAPAVFVPGADLEPATTIARFRAARAGYDQALADAAGLDLGRIKARSAVSPLFRLNLATWFASDLAHGRRHLEQARRLRAHAAFPSP